MEVAIYFYRTVDQWNGFSQSILISKQNREIPKVDGDIRVFGSVGLLVDGQRAAHQRLGLRQTVRGLK